MSFVTSIRDYVETLNTISESLGQDLTLTRFVSETALYILKTLQASLFYVVSFQWIRDFSLLPIVLPKVSFFKETFFLETPSQVFFEFLEIPDLHQNKFLLGVFNSFFLSLPLSVVYVVAIRRLLIQGIPAGVYSIGGYLVGQILFLGCTIFGVRQILIPWLTFEPLSYILGLVLIFRIIYSMTGETLIPLKGWFLPQYKSFFFTSFVLAWCEQSSIFQYLGNLTASSNVTILENFSSSSPISNFFSHFIYLIGISSGCLFFTFLWGLFFLQLKNLWMVYTPLYLTSFIQFTNKTSFVLALAFSLTSIPFYGFDYLLTGPLGFVSQDTLFENTMFEERNEKVTYPNQQLSGPETGYKYIHLDFAPFDRGEYAIFSENTPVGFEDLNYRGEFAWTTISNNPGINQSKSTFLSLPKMLKTKKKNPQDSLLQTRLSETEQQNSLIFPQGDSFGPSQLKTNTILDRIFENSSLRGLEDTNFLLPYRELSKKSFPVDFLRPPSPSSIEQKFKEKYYSNPIYKALLALDVDLFLKRQPKTFQVNPEQQSDLYTKRRILESYYNSLREYSNFPANEVFELYFDGAKSFSNQVYNQQFKGTLRSVRRLFLLTLTNTSTNFDKIGFKDINIQTDSFERESESENNEIQTTPSNKFEKLDSNDRNIQNLNLGTESNSSTREKLQTVLKFDQPLYDLEEKQEFYPYHEELGNQFKSSQNIQPTTELFTKPLYAGWDERVRKFVITNKLLSRKRAGYQVQIEPEMRQTFSQDSSNSQQKIKFTTWPLKAPENQTTIPYITLYQNVSQEVRNLLIQESDSSYNFTTLPANLKRYMYGMVSDSGQKESTQYEPLAPKRGGFIWPGNSKITSPFSQLTFPFFAK